MNNVNTLLALSLLSGIAPAYADEQYPVTAPPNYIVEADAYARAAGLKPLAASNDRELRLWAINFRGKLRGVVITSSGIKQFVSSERYGKDHLATVKTAQTTPNTQEVPVAPILGLLEDLKSYDGRLIDCAVMTDGYGFLVEGTTGGRRFAFFSQNPGSCGDDASRLLVKTLGLMPGVSLDAP